MNSVYAGLILALAVIAAGVLWYYLRSSASSRPVPSNIRRGQTLPMFEAATETGESRSSHDLRGTVAVLLFVRGSWCPFCNAQVADLTKHYKRIVDSGARLVLVTPKPLATTRRVAAFYNVDFEFWLDDNLAITHKLGLLDTAGVPEGFRDEYGSDTVWPAAMVVDAEGRIRYVRLSRDLSDRPDAAELLAAVTDLTAR